jgi:hypothetical protein
MPRYFRLGMFMAAYISLGQVKQLRSSNDRFCQVRTLGHVMQYLARLKHVRPYYFRLGRIRSR